MTISGGADCNMLWIGSRMGPMERACARSVLRQGHKLRIWCYEAIEGLPDGVEVADAAEVLAESKILRHQSGSVALFSNWFRYELQRRCLGTWLDSDMYLLKPIETERPYLLAQEEPGIINGAILRLPADSPLLPRLLKIFGQRTVPSWLPLREKLAVYKRLALTGRTGLELMRWGVAGPLALTTLARRFGLLSQADDAEVYYPVHWQHASWIVDPSVDVDDWVTPRTRALHLWNEVIKELKDKRPPKGSFLHRLWQEGA